MPMKKGPPKDKRPRWGGSIDGEEDALREYLGEKQSNIKLGVGILGKDNGVVVIFSVKKKGGKRKGGRGKTSVVKEHIAGASLHHVAGCQKCVSVADHSLAGCIEDWGGIGRKLEVFGILAEDFRRLDEHQKFDVRELRRAGAVKAVAYKSLAEDSALRSAVTNEEGERTTPDGIDVAIIKFKEPLKGLKVSQPIVLTEKKARRVSQYYRTHPGAKVKIRAEGIGRRISKWSGQRNTRKVNWFEPGGIRWTRTRTAGMNAGDFAKKLKFASYARVGARKRGLRDAGRLSLTELYVPAGFSGGPVYLNLPAKALRPNAGPNAPDIAVLLGNCSAWVPKFEGDPERAIHTTRIAFLTKAWIARRMSGQLRRF